MKFILSILIIVASGILFFAVVNPLYNDVSKLRTEVAAYNLALSNSTDLQKTRDQLVDTYKKIPRENRERLEHFLPNTVNNIKFILEIERIANMHSMPIKNIKFEPERVQPDTKTTGTAPTTIVTSSDPTSSLPYGTFPVEFTTEGDYNTFVQFLKDIEQNLRLVDVKNISFTVPYSDKYVAGFDPNIYTFSLKVETYWLK